jgi:hypothetical protein
MDTLAAAIAASVPSTSEYQDPMMASHVAEMKAKADERAERKVERELELLLARIKYGVEEGII